MSGFVIAIDGPDGVGKTTQLKLLAEYLTAQKQKVYTTRASGGTAIGEELRKASLSDYPRHPETDLYISLAMHTELGYDLQQRKTQGELVVVDRSPLAIMAYNGYGSQLSDLSASAVACQNMLNLWQIDLLLVLEAPQTILNERLRSRYKEDSSTLNYFEKQGETFFQRVHDGYAAAMTMLNKRANNESPILTRIEATGSIEDIHQTVIAAVQKLKLPDITT